MLQMNTHKHIGSGTSQAGLHAPLPLLQTSETFVLAGIGLFLQPMHSPDSPKTTIFRILHRYFAYCVAFSARFPQCLSLFQHVFTLPEIYVFLLSFNKT